jgi:hypothetical protein
VAVEEMVAALRKMVELGKVVELGKAEVGKVAYAE